jgi:aminoglycoside/choline kinase family phosphotransferase
MRAPDFGSLEKLVDRCLRPRSGGSGEGPARVTEMPGGASTRRYFRVERTGDAGAAPKTAVAMFVPEGGKPEEIAKDGARARWPFLEVRDLLAASGVDVPALYGEDQDDGWLLIEDLGDDTLANFLARNEPARESLYRRAVEDLARAQRALARLPAESIVATRAFDADLLRWEIDHFREWGLEARGHHLSAADRATFDAIADRLARRIAGWPRGFVHRDYQSRNLMVRHHAGDASLCWIDFQDALLGPRVYDLVALLSDSYQTFDRDFVEARLRDYAAAMGDPNLDEIVEQFDYVTVQRKLKDAGRFVFIDRKKGNDSFLRFVEPTISKVDTALVRLSAHDPDMKALWDLLRRTLQNGRV